MNISTLAVGILGAGFMSRTYAEIIHRHIDGARLLGVACGSRAAQLAADYNIECFDTVEAMLAAPGLDVVIIATPHAQHFAAARAALLAGKHIVLEKPMTTRLEDADELLRLAAAKQLQLTIMFGQRYRICNIAARRIIQSGELGALRHIESFHVVGDGMRAVPRWQLLPENIGILIGHGIHNFDQVRWFTGSEITSVIAQCGSLDPQSQVEGTSQVLLNTDVGCTASIFCSFELPAPGFPRTQFGARLAFESGLLDLDAYGELRMARAGGPWEVLATQPAVDWHGKGFLDPVRLESYRDLLRDFFLSIHQGTPPPITGWDGRQALAGALAAYAASASGERVEVSNLLISKAVSS